MKKGKRARRRRLVSRAFLIVFILIIFYFLVKPLAKVDYQLANLKLESIQLNNNIARLEHGLNSLQAKLTFRTSNPGIEIVARQRGLVYPGETLYTCSDSQGRQQDYLRFDNEPQPLAKKYTTKTPLSKAWDMILSLFR